MNAWKMPIDYESLEEELQEALKADEFYKLRNDAKFRAIEQRVPTYEDFRQIVNGAHLRPVDRNDKKSKLQVPWNAVTYLKNSQDVVENIEKSEISECTANFIPAVIPKSCEEFLTRWRGLPDFKDKFQYLWTIRYTLQKEIFCIEIPPLLFGELLQTCYENIAIAENTLQVIDVLKIFSECNRFSLCVSFMTKLEKEICAKLFKKLSDDCNEYEELTMDIIALSKKYQVTPK